MQLRRLPLVIFKSGVSRRVLSAGLAGIALASFSGCAYGNVRQVLRAQFASDVDCSEVTIKKRDFWYVSDNPHQYKISGCGVMRTYTCTAEDGEGLISYDEPACKWEEGDSDAPKPKPSSTTSDSMDEGMDDGMYEEPMDEPSDMDEPPAEEPAAEDDGLDADADLDADGDASKGKVKAKAKGGLKLGSD